MAFSLKRKRTGSDSNLDTGNASASLLSQALAPTPLYALNDCIQELGDAKHGILLKDIILDLAKQQPYIANVIRTAYHKNNADRDLERRITALTQDAVKSSELLVFGTYDHNSSLQRQIATGVARKIQESTWKIRKMASDPVMPSRFRTLGLTSLVEICEALFTGRASHSRAIPMMMPRAWPMCDNMVAIVRSMSEQERLDKCRDEDGEPSLSQRLLYMQDDLTTDEAGDWFFPLEAVIHALEGNLLDNDGGLE